MKFENIVVGDFESAIRAARMPFKSFDNMDSYYSDRDILYVKWRPYHIGDADMKLLQNLLRAGSSDAKFMRAIDVSVEITAPVFWLAEADTYKIATVRNSSSLQHTGSLRDYKESDFDFKDNFKTCDAEDIDALNQYISTMLQTVNHFRNRYKETGDYTFFRIMRKCIPMSYEYTIAWHSNYAVLRNIWKQRIKTPHRLREWTQDFSGFIEKLPYAKELIMFEG